MIFILIGFSLVVAIGFLIAFIWSVRNGQYEDEYTPSVRILFDDDPPETRKEEPAKKHADENGQTESVKEPKT